MSDRCYEDLQSQTGFARDFDTLTSLLHMESKSLFLNVHSEAKASLQMHHHSARLSQCFIISSKALPTYNTQNAKSSTNESHKQSQTAPLISRDISTVHKDRWAIEG